MSCRTCEYYQKPSRFGYDEIVGEKGECHFGKIHRKVNPHESCAFDTTWKAAIGAATKET